MIILLDGAKGAGKSSVARIVLERSNNARFLSLDIERRALKDRDKSRTELNKEAFQNILDKARAALRDGKDIVIDCGLIQERVPAIEELAASADAKLHKFFLKASPEVLLERVRARDRENGKITDVERFEETFKLTASKDLDDFIVIETGPLSAEEVADRVLAAIKTP